MSGNNTKTRLRKYSARVFTPGGMFCPHCQAELDTTTETCPECSFNLEECQKSFPFAAPPLALILDPSHFLPAGIEADLKKSYRKLRKCVPQVDIAFCFVRLQVESPLEEFAFWLHNTAPGAGPARAWQLLVVGDLTSGRLTLSSGYALEPFLKHELWEAALQEMAACFSDEEWKEGLNGFLTEARDLLASSWQIAERRRQGNHRRRAGKSPPPPGEQEQHLGNDSEEPETREAGVFPTDKYGAGISPALRETEGNYQKESANS